MPHLVFHPNLWGYVLFLIVLSIMGMVSVSLTRGLQQFLQAAAIVIPLCGVWFLVVSVIRRDWHERLELDEHQIIFHDGQTLYQLRYEAIERVELWRGNAFDGQSPEYLTLTPHGATEPFRWNIADFSFSIIMRFLSELVIRAGLSGIEITQHQGNEKQLRATARKLGTLTLLPDHERFYQTLLFTPHR